MKIINKYLQEAMNINLAKILLYKGPEQFIQTVNSWIDSEKELAKQKCKGDEICLSKMYYDIYVNAAYSISSMSGICTERRNQQSCVRLVQTYENQINNNIEKLDQKIKILHQKKYGNVKQIAGINFKDHGFYFTTNIKIPGCSDVTEVMINEDQVKYVGLLATITKLIIQNIAIIRQRVIGDMDIAHISFNFHLDQQFHKVSISFEERKEWNTKWITFDLRTKEFFKDYVEKEKTEEKQEKIDENDIYKFANKDSENEKLTPIILKNQKVILTSGEKTSDSSLTIYIPHRVINQSLYYDYPEYGVVGKDIKYHSLSYSSTHTGSQPGYATFSSSSLFTYGGQSINSIIQMMRKYKEKFEILNADVQVTVRHSTDSGGKGSTLDVMAIDIVLKGKSKFFTTNKLNFRGTSFIHDYTVYLLPEKLLATAPKSE